MRAPLPPDEAQRLEALRHYDVLDSLPEPAFDDLALLAAQICGTPIALISFIDATRQWFKSRVGIRVAEIPREIGFCAHAISCGGAGLEVHDATADARFADNPLVTSDPHIRFYASAPLIARDGHALGTLCVADRTPRRLSDDQTLALHILSRQVVALLELRRRTNELLSEATARQRAEALLRKRYGQPAMSEDEKDRLLVLSEKSRRALLSVLEDEQRVGKELRESEDRLREFAENVHEVFWMTDPAKEQMLYVSPAYDKIWGRSRSGLYESPKSWQDAIHPADRSRIQDAVATKQARGDYDETYRIRRLDGAVRWIHERAFPVRGEAGELLRLVGTAEDITERRQLEDQLRQSQKLEAIGQLAGGVAHDFNNILTVIQGYGSLLMTERLAEEAADAAEQIVLASERAANLTRQLLAFSRRQVMRPRRLDLNEVVTSITKMVQRILGEDVSLQLHPHSRPLMTRADAGMLDQILMNLVVNARDAMPEGGQLFIETEEKNLGEEEARGIPGATSGRHVCLRARDTGCGISAEDLPRIFEPFFTTKELGKGTGLGLATVFGLVAQHGGFIRVDSEVGRGTTFEVFLPMAEAFVEPSAEATAKPRPQGGTETILLVEDEPSVRRLTRAMLERSGYAVLEAEHGVEALQVWEQHKGVIRLVLTDIVMPERINGLELAARLQSLDPKLRVVFTSGYNADMAGRRLSLREGQNFIQKPYSPQELLETVRHCLDSSPREPSGDTGPSGDR